MPEPHTVVAYTAYTWEHALTTLRLVRPLQEAGLQLIRGNNLGEVFPEKVPQGDVVVIQRDFPHLLEIYESIIALARAHGKAVIYEIDDLLIELPEEHPDYPLHYYTPAIFPMIRAIIEADLVTTTTPALKAYLQPLNTNICVLPNCLDDQAWTMHSPQTSSERAEVTIGYMGSNTHQPDLELIVPVYVRLLERYRSRLCLRFWGGEPPVAIRDHPQVEWIPLQLANYLEFARYFSGQTCDIFVAPLVDNHFNRCKSPIKFLEYSSQGIPAVYSRVTPYETIVHHGEDGYLATTLDEWEANLIQLVENPALRVEIGQQALRAVRRDWLLSQHARQWNRAYQTAQELCSDQDAQQRKQALLRIFSQAVHRVNEWQIQLSQDNRELKSRLAEAERFRNEVTSSTAWRFVQLGWKLRRVLAPPGSTREKALKNILHKSASPSPDKGI